MLTARKHGCVPMLFLQLKKDNLQTFIPSNILNTLKLTYQTNSLRTMLLVQETKKVADELHHNEIPVILLKGAATFADHLYDDLPARSMQDIDILVQPEHLREVVKVLDGLGYQRINQEGNIAPVDLDCIQADPDDHHLSPFYNPKFHVAIEVHYVVHHNWSGTLLPAEEVWKSAQEAKIDNVPVLILAPEQRLYHNASHALLAEHSYIKTQVSLKDLLEFSCLAEKYHTIDWQAWLKKSEQVKLVDLFSVYIQLAQVLFFLPTQELKDISRKKRRQVKGFIDAGNYLAANQDAGRTFEQKLTGWKLQFLYYARLPLWMWHNARYSVGGGSLSGRLKLLLRKIANSESRKKSTY